MSGRIRPTIYDVAQQAGVSKSLVSLVLNGSDQVSEAKRLAVLEAIEALGYRRSHAASSLARHRTHTVGLIVDDFENPWFVPLLHGLRETLAPQGLHVAIREQRPVAGKGVHAIEEFLESEVDALVVAAEPGRDYGALGIPTVVESTRLHAIAGADGVCSDQVAGAKLAVDHLVAQGHKRIGHVTGTGGAAATRREGYARAMATHGLEALIAGEQNETTDEGGYLGAAALLFAHPDVTAVFTANDTMAQGARAALLEFGRRVPHDIALVGHDNSPAARSRLMDLTTIDPCNHEVGVRAAHALLRRMGSPDEAPEDIRVAPRLVVRSSSLVTGPLPSTDGRETSPESLRLCNDKYCSKG